MVAAGIVDAPVGRLERRLVVVVVVVAGDGTAYVGVVVVVVVGGDCGVGAAAVGCCLSWRPSAHTVLSGPIRLG